jgi:hypothetical protein
LGLEGLVVGRLPGAALRLPRAIESGPFGAEIAMIRETGSQNRIKHGSVPFLPGEGD